MAADTRAESESVVELIITVGDTTGDPGQQNSWISVFLTNVFDEVAAFEVWLRMSRPDILEFQTNLDTVVDTTYWICNAWSGSDCIDSVASEKDSAWDIRHIDTVEVFTGNLDTAGTLISGWDFVTTRSITGSGTDIKVSAIADRPNIPGTPPPISTQSGGVLFRLLGDIQDVPDSMTDRGVDIFVQPFLDHFSFSRSDGSSIGILTQEVEDTSYYRCNSWVPPDSVQCLDWEEVTALECGPECDSLDIDTITVGVLDTAAVKFIDGSVTVNMPPPWECGDFDDSEVIDIGDLTLLINALFITIQPPADPLEKANVDCSGELPLTIDIGDVTALIRSLFITVEPLCCAP
jgi:hypothetical protein